MRDLYNHEVAAYRLHAAEDRPPGSLQVSPPLNVTIGTQAD
jgi:hypothetical protein